MTDALAARCARAVHVLTSDGTLLGGGRASLLVLERIGFSRLARVLRVPPLVWLVDVGYWVVARNRPFFARFLFRRE
jgi:predicted DCC family thiol-disulfide oxidoreductase YuxK